MRYLFTGSRESSAAALNYARAQVRLMHIARLNEGKDHEIVVGDAEGVDKAVIEAALSHEVPFHVYGVAPDPRCMGKHWRLRFGDLGRYSQVYAQAKLPEARSDWRAAYLRRDRVMVEDAHVCVAIWNGYSTGTRYTFEYARSKGLQVYVKVFKL